MEKTIQEALLEFELTGEGSGRAKYLLREGLSVFEGHFPGLPVSPGVFQMEMALQTAARVLERPIEMLEVSRSKFLTMVRPGQEVIVEVKLMPVDAATEDSEGPSAAWNLKATAMVDGDAAMKLSAQVTLID